MLLSSPFVVLVLSRHEEEENPLGEASPQDRAPLKNPSGRDGFTRRLISALFFYLDRTIAVIKK